MKVNAKDLFEVVRQVVREEVAKQLPAMVREHLAESYMRKMVGEAVKTSGKPVVSELMVLQNEIEEEETPSPQPNTDKGIYHDKELRKNENVNKLMTKKNPMAFVYEGVKMPGEEGDGMPSVPLDKIKTDFSKMNALLEATEQNVSSRREMSVSAESKMRELEMRRKALEIPVGGSKSG